MEEKTEELFKSPDFLTKIINSLAFPFYIIDAKDFRIVVANNSLKSKGPLTAKTKCYEITHKRKTPCTDKHTCPLREVLRTKKEVKAEHIHYDDKGNERIVEVHGYPLFDNAGNVTHMIEYAIDITEQKNTESELSKQKEFSDAIISSMTDGLDVVDEDMKIQFMNKTFETIFGKEAINKKCYELYKDNKEKCKECPLKKKISLGETKNLIVECMLNGKTFEIRHTGIMLPNGKKGILELFRDITEQEKTAKDNIIFAAALEQAVESIIITSPDAKIIYANPSLEKITGYNKEELIGKNPSIFSSGRQDNNFYKELWKTIHAGKTWHGELINKKKNGEEYTEEVTITPILGSNNKIMNYLGIKFDVSQKKKSEKELKEKVEMLEKFKSTTVDYLLEMKRIEEENIQLKNKIITFENKK